MKKLVKLNKRPLCGGQKFTYILRYKDENGRPLVMQINERLKSSVPRRK